MKEKQNNFSELAYDELLDISGGCGCEKDGTNCHCGEKKVDTTIGIEVKGKN